MSRLPKPGSSTLLLRRLLECPSDAETWDQFVERYSGAIYTWCCRHRLQDADARDVTQDVFAALLRGLQGFDRSRARFRTWLYQIVLNCVRDWCGSRAYCEEKGTEAARRSLASVPASRDLEARLNEEFDLELLDLAELSVRLQVAPQSWDAYQLRCKEGLSLRQAAQRLGIPAGHVSKYALRVRDMLARQITLLDAPPGPKETCGMEDQHDPLPAGADVGGVPEGPAEPE